MLASVSTSELGAETVFDRVRGLGDKPGLKSDDEVLLEISVGLLLLPGANSISAAAMLLVEVDRRNLPEAFRAIAFQPPCTSGLAAEEGEGSGSARSKSAVVIEYGGLKVEEVKSGEGGAV